MADINTNTLWSGIFGTVTSLAGLGTQSLKNQEDKINGDAAVAIQALKNQKDISDQAYALESTRIQTERDDKLSTLKLAQRKQSYTALGLILGGLGIIAIIIILAVRSTRS